MSSELQKYIDIDSKKKVLNAEVIDFPKEKNVNNSKTLNITEKSYNFWKINDENNSDQFKAVKGICFMFSALILMGLYSNLI